MSTTTKARALIFAAPAMSIITLFMIVPMGIAIYFSFLSPDVYGGAEPPLSIQSYVGFFFDKQLDGTYEFTWTYGGIFWRSFKLAAATTMICTALGFLFAWYVSWQDISQKKIILLLVSIPFFTNSLIRTYSWVLLLRDTGLVNNFIVRHGAAVAPIHLLYNDAAILLGLTYTFLPFMILPIYATLEKVDVRVIEAALDLYATRYMLVKNILLPLARPGIVAGAMMVFAPALGSFLVSDMLGGGQHLLIGSLIQNQFSSGRDWPFGAALSVLTTIPVLFGYFFLLKKTNHE